MKPTFFKSLLLLVFTQAWLASAPSAKGATFFWSSDVPDLLFDSNEQPLSGYFSFELGVFTGGFVPTADNIGQWATYWQVFDRAFDPTPAIPDDGDPNGWNVENQFFVGTVEHTATGTSSSPYADPGAVFQQGQVVYLWVFNKKTREADTEWALVTDGLGAGDIADDWVITDPADGGSYDWQLADANLAILGNLNGTLSGGQPFTLQTVLVPVPEPAAVVFLGLAALGGLTLRRRGPFL